MGTGVLEDGDLAGVLDLVAYVPGDLAEVGVFGGHLFRRLVGWAFDRDILAHAFDSFLGMDDPGPYDDAERYPRGALSVGGLEVFLQLMDKAGLARDWYRTWPGLVPHCLHDAGSQIFRFVYVDLDHHRPTVDTIPWAWSSLSPGGVLGFDDCFPGRDAGPSKAIRESRILTGAEVVAETSNNQIFFRK